MTKNMLRTVLLVTSLVVFLSQLSLVFAGDTLSPDDIAVIQRGYRLYQRGEFAGSYAGGQYTDPNLDSKVMDFWTNGKFARYDRNGDGHHETILEIARQRLFYIGTIDANGIFIDVSKKHPEYLRQSLSVYINALGR